MLFFMFFLTYNKTCTFTETLRAYNAFVTISSKIINLFLQNHCNISFQFALPSPGGVYNFISMFKNFKHSIYFLGQF